MRKTKVDDATQDLVTYLLGPDVRYPSVRDDIDIDIDRLIEKGKPTAMDVLNLYLWMKDAADLNHAYDLAAFITFRRLMKEMKPLPV
jgi:hypothetical protein